MEEFGTCVHTIIKEHINIINYIKVHIYTPPSKSVLGVKVPTLYWYIMYSVSWQMNLNVSNYIYCVFESFESIY